jgi:hypothetical protein
MSIHQDSQVAMDGLLKTCVADAEFSRVLSLNCLEDHIYDES